MASQMYNEKYRRPNISFTEMLKKGAGGVFVEKGDYIPFMYRAVVIAMDSEGGLLESPDGYPMGGGYLHVTIKSQKDTNRVLATYVITPTLGPYNPKNSVRARILTNNLDQVINDDDLRTYWPLFPGADTPSAGELVYVVFEDEAMMHGLWVAKVPYPETEPDSDGIKPNKNVILLGEQLQKIEDNPTAALFNDSAPASPMAPGSVNPNQDPQRISDLFIG